MSFDKLNLIEPIQRALKIEGYSIPTPIQKQAIPIILEGKDVLGSAQTGTGKTAAFAIPIIQMLSQNQDYSKGRRKIRALVVTPTRELAIQIGDSFAAYGRFTDLRHTVIYGGVKQLQQTNALQKGIDILIATPGRLLDLMDQGYVNLQSIRFFVLDEADRMLDMGFIHDVRKIITKLPARRQSLFFSATMPKEVTDLAAAIVNQPSKVNIAPVKITTEAIQQSVYYVDKEHKKSLILHVLKDPTLETALVFTRTKYGADKLAKYLNINGIRSNAIHGDKTQNARQQALSGFKKRAVRVLVASDIASRGLDIDELSCVMNFDIPDIPDTYVHRIGRTGRAGATGRAISFCTPDEKGNLKRIEKILPAPIPVILDHPFLTNLRVTGAIAPSGKDQSSPKPRFIPSHKRWAGKPAWKKKPAR
ncbi:MAG: DEAD/DEAH box helicase [Candidatus Marinimicrobia bacterium]|nr:DEAD/DEAH box helicase [Candidatus Neomarinimicrobiota bacterium]